MNDITNKLLGYKKEIEQAKADLSKTEGKLEQLLEELQDKFECKTVKQAQAKLKKIEKEISGKEEGLQKAIDEFDATYKERLEG